MNGSDIELFLVRESSLLVIGVVLLQVFMAAYALMLFLVCVVRVLGSRKRRV